MHASATSHALLGGLVESCTWFAVTYNILCVLLPSLPHSPRRNDDLKAMLEGNKDNQKLEAMKTIIGVRVIAKSAEK